MQNRLDKCIAFVNSLSEKEVVSISDKELNQKNTEIHNIS